MIELSVSVPKYGILPYESHISSIINCYTKENINFLCSMLNMKCIILEQRNTKQEYFDFFIGYDLYVPELSFSYENRKELNTKEKLLDFIQKHLKRKEYVIVAIDTSKVSSYSNFLKNSIIHPPMISGLDLANSKILIHDFMDYSKYQSSWISIDEFFEAYSEVQNKIILNSSVNKSLEEELWVSHLELIRFNKNTVINNSYIEKRVIRELFNYYCSINKRVVDIDAYSYVNSILNDTDTFLYKKEVVEGRGVLECYQNYLLTVRDSESKLKLKPFYKRKMSKTLDIVGFSEIHRIIVSKH